MEGTFECSVCSWCGVQADKYMWYLQVQKEVRGEAVAHLSLVVFGWIPVLQPILNLHLCLRGA